MNLSQLQRVRWGIRAVLFLGVAASTTANVLHALPNPISQCIAAWPPLALLITIEVISRVPIHRRALALARVVATATIAGIAAWVSYWHMAGVASKYGETGASPYLLPLSVDGLIVVASICLVELAGRIRETQVSMPVSTPADRIVWQYDRPIGPEPGTEEVDKLSTRSEVARKPHASAKERVERAHKRYPQATHEQLADRLKLSAKTVQRWRPPRAAEELVVNGREPEFALIKDGSDG